MTVKRLLRHIYGLTNMIYRCISGRESTISDSYSLEEIRRLTLDKILEIREILLRMRDDQLAATNVLHSRRGKFPFWYMINGPLCDALTHIGQIASWRRINGNPIPKVSVFFGKPLE
jgi:hypothetical protein